MYRSRFLTSLAIAVLCASNEAAAAEWMLVAEYEGNEGMVWVDTVGITRAKKLRKAWFKNVFFELQRIPDGLAKDDANVRLFSHSLDLKYFNCEERTSATAQVIYRDSSGKVVTTYSVKEALFDWTEVAPETIGEAMLDYVCKMDLEAPRPKALPEPPPSPKPTPEELRNRS